MPAPTRPQSSLCPEYNLNAISFQTGSFAEFSLLKHSCTNHALGESLLSQTLGISCPFEAGSELPELDLESFADDACSQLPGLGGVLVLGGIAREEFELPRASR